ncbi:MAG: di-trans,poly-cis-decaprenylcistransferase [Methanocorpusculum parvum]|nr:di-trans,poly-cis-decaprenylcistransferase [Methanocorpusculum parvum]
MIYELYEKHIRKGLEVFPEELCLMLTDAELASDSKKLVSMLKWVTEFQDIKRFIIHISTDSEYIPLPLSEMEKYASIRVSSSHGDERYGCGALDVLIVIGKCGRQEICDAVSKIAESGISPEDITEETIEENLLYKVTPDFIIKTGGNYLTDFLIWQSVYSELFFCDVNWHKFRYVDFLRALRDFQSRQRRFGK